MTFKLEPLGYDFNALEPVIDAKTMEIHHDKHHQTYVNNLNKAVEGTEYEKYSIEELMKHLKDAPVGVKNNAGGHYNHSLFWETMTPGGSKEPTGELKEAIDKKFGSFDEFKKEFEKKAAGQFGSGWGWLVVDNGELEVVATPNQDSPISDGKAILLGNDVWEHAYYLSYQNRRADYLSAWWDVVNWDIVAKRYEQAK